MHGTARREPPRVELAQRVLRVRRARGAAGLDEPPRALAGCARWSSATGRRSSTRRAPRSGSYAGLRRTREGLELLRRRSEPARAADRDLRARSPREPRRASAQRSSRTDAALDATHTVIDAEGTPHRERWMSLNWRTTRTPRAVHTAAEYSRRRVVARTKGGTCTSSAEASTASSPGAGAVKEQRGADPAARRVRAFDGATRGRPLLLRATDAHDLQRHPDAVPGRSPAARARRRRVTRQAAHAELPARGAAAVTAGATCHPGAAAGATLLRSTALPTHEQ